MRRKVDPVLQMQRYLARCEECGDCLLWTGPSNSAGCPHVGSQSLRRLVWSMREGPICKGMSVINTCGRPECLEHLGLLSTADVLRRTLSRPDVRARRAAAARGQMRKAAQKLDMSKARAMRREAATKTQTALAREYGVRQSLVWRILHNKAWREPTPFDGLGARG